MQYIYTHTTGLIFSWGKFFHEVFELIMASAVVSIDLISSQEKEAVNYADKNGF